MEFEDKFLNVISLLKNLDSGLLTGRLYREIGDCSEYMLYTEWEDLEFFKKCMTSRKYALTVEFGKSIVDGQPRHEIFH